MLQYVGRDVRDVVEVVRGWKGLSSLFPFPPAKVVSFIGQISMEVCLTFESFERRGFSQYRKPELREEMSEEKPLFEGEKREQ